MKPYDVIVIGAGPAGAASALFLEGKGYRVALLDRSRFPRDKVCGEFISPAADALLQKIGVLDSVEALEPMRLQGVVLSAHEFAQVTIDYPCAPDGGGGGEMMSSLSLSRRQLDALLVDQAKSRGITVLEEHQVTDFIFSGDRVAGVVGRDASNAKFTLSAKMVVDAGGRNCISLKRFQLKKNSAAKKGKVAMAAHWQVAQGLPPYCFMHISPPGYTGIAPTDKESANVVLVVESDRLKNKNVEEFYLETVMANRERRELLAGARMEEKVRTIDSLSYAVKAPSVDGLLLVGDAMGFIDPFTGEGIYLSLKSAEMAAENIAQAMAQSDFSRGMISVYEKRREKEFHKKFLLSKLIERLIDNPFLCKRVVLALAGNPRLAEQLVGVIGDYIPAEKVMSPRFGLRLVMAMLKPGGGRHLPCGNTPSALSQER